MFILNDLCTNSNFLTLFLFLKIIFTIVCILVPIVLIFRILVPFFKTLISGDDVTSFLGPIVKSCISGVVIFLLPSILSFVFVDLINFDDNNISTCFVNATLDNIKYYQNLEEQEREEEAAAAQEDLEEAIKEKEEKEAAEREEIKKYNETSGGSTDNNISSGEITIHIGDSRTVGMCAAMTGDWSNCPYSNGGAKYSGNDIYIAQSSMGYSWFASTAIPAVNSILNSNPDVQYNIISYMGVNYLLSDVDKYISKYNELAEGDWNGQNIIAVSVNPVNESVEASHGYSTKNSNIETFNTKLRSGINTSKIKYCDIYNSIIDDFSTTDGLHYNSSTYKNIYSLALGCI